MEKTPLSGVMEETENEAGLKEEDGNLKDLQEQLENITFKVEDVDEKKDELDASEFPESYKQNNDKEKLAIAYAENFRKQYVHLFRDRQPLILYPLNECGVEKLVCTTVKPTLLPFKQLYHWQGCAEFVADYITLEQLPVSYKVPESLYSPTTVLKRQRGTCFDYSTLLCSLLLGAGYDAYVVSGYASKEICLSDESRDPCPLFKKDKEVVVKEESVESEYPPEPKKYAVKPPRDLQSKFERKMRLKKEKEAAKFAEKQRLKEEELIRESEKPPADPLYGLRVHSWVLVKGGKREVPDHFFIEPFTGRDYPQSSPSFLGIESVWNHTNYWANMQDCSNGCADLQFNLYNTVCWEYLMEGAVPSRNEVHNDVDDADMLELDDDDEEKEDPAEETVFLDVPASWVAPIEVTPKQFESRCPSGKKTILYRKALLEKYAEYLLPDGLVTRLLVYDDIEQSNMLRTEEGFANRVDCLSRRIDDHEYISEHFAQGRPEGLKIHRYKKNDLEPFGERTMEFYDHIRVDGLKTRSDCTNEMVEHFIDREDRKYFRRVLFGKAVKKSEASDELIRPILKITEKFHRNPEVDANEDVAVRMFVVADDKITLMFHRHDETITASKREFYKPPQAEEKGGSLPWNNEMSVAFQVLHPDSKKPSKKALPIYQNLLELIHTEQKTIKDVRGSEEETYLILQDRIEQNLQNELKIIVYDTDRNEKAKKHRRELEILAEEEKKRKKDQDMDYLAPFLAQIGNPTKLSPTQAYKLKEDCLADLKQRLIDKANLIQLRFEKETSELHKRQQDYQQKQVAMTKEDEEEYFNYCSEAMFRIHILEMRLNRHKQIAPSKYMAMEQKLRQDPRLSNLL